MRRNVRDRLLLPIVLPVAILAFIAAILWGFSRILLGLTATAATITAIIAAIGIVAISAVAAGRTIVRGSTVAAMLGAVAGLAMLAGGIALAVVAGEGEREEQPDGEPGAVVALVAENIAFQPTSLSVVAREPFTIAFDNRDADTQHNVEIFDNPEFSGTPLFDGDLITGPAKATYEVEPLEAGTFYFRCVVHPTTMTGEIQVAEEPGEPGGEPGGGPGGEPPGGAAVPVVAQGIAFDTDTIELPAEAPSTIAFDNRDAQPHNIAIYSDQNLGEVLFQGEIVTGPTMIDYPVGPLPAGEYYFQCDVHPTMNGTVMVR